MIDLYVIGFVLTWIAASFWFYDPRKGRTDWNSVFSNAIFWPLCLFFALMYLIIRLLFDRKPRT